MNNTCDNCAYLMYDRDTCTYDCRKSDRLEYEEFEKYFGENQPGCPYWEQECNYTMLEDCEEDDLK